MRQLIAVLGLLALGVPSAAFAQVSDSYIYDALGRLTGTSSVIGSATANLSGYSYDPAGNRSFVRTDNFAQPINSSELQSGEQIVLRQALHSPNGQVHLTFQSDGNLILYCSTGIKWATWSYGSQAQFFAMNTNGNLVVYGPNMAEIWKSNTLSPGAKLVLRNDGNLVIYQGSSEIWSSQTAGTC